MTFGLTAAGFKTMRLPDIKASLDNAMIANFGEIDLSPGTTTANVIAPFAQAAATVWENLDDVYQSQYPASAYGTSLDRVVQINGITRLPATQSQVQCLCYGQEASLIPADSQVLIPATGEVFASALDANISQSNGVYDLLQVSSLAAQAYQITINSITYFYSLPTITFSTDFVASNVIVIPVNNADLAPVTYTTDQATTMGLLQTALQALPSVASVTISGSNQVLTIFPVVGYENTVGDVQITGGVSQPTVAYAFAAPATYNEITASLSAIVNGASLSITAVDNMDQSFSLTSTIVNEAMTPFNLVNGLNTTVLNRATQVTFYAQNYGPVAAPVGSVTQIVTPTYGWNSVTNLIAGLNGQNIETDSQLRIRRKNSILVVGAGTVEAIRARLLQFVPNVLENGVTILENTTMFQVDGTFTLNTALISGDSIVVILNGNTLPAVAYNDYGSSVAALTALAAYIALQPNVASASVGGTGNLTVTIVWDSATINTIGIVTVTPSVNPVFISNGRPPKCFEAIVQGGLDQDIGNQIWLTKPAGIESYGGVTVTVVDSQGNDQSISFSRPTDLYIWVTVALTLDTTGTFPANGIDLVQQAILNYGDSLEIGESVYFQRVLSQIFTVSGIASGAMTTAYTSLPTQTPVPGTADIAVNATSISAWDIGRIMVTVV